MYTRKSTVGIADGWFICICAKLGTVLNSVISSLVSLAREKFGEVSSRLALLRFGLHFGLDLSGVFGALLEAVLPFVMEIKNRQKICSTGKCLGVAIALSL